MAIFIAMILFKCYHNILLIVKSDFYILCFFERDILKIK